MLSLTSGSVSLVILLLTISAATARADDTRCNVAVQIHHTARALFDAAPRCAAEPTPLRRAGCFRRAILKSQPAAAHPARDPHCPPELAAVAAGALQSIIATAQALDRGLISPDAARAQAAAVLAAWTQRLTDAVAPPATALAEQNRSFDSVSDGTVRLNRTIQAIFPDHFADLIDIRCQTADAGARTFTSCYAMLPPAPPASSRAGSAAAPASLPPKAIPPPD